MPNGQNIAPILTTNNDVVDMGPGAVTNEEEFNKKIEEKII